MVVMWRLWLKLPHVFLRITPVPHVWCVSGSSTGLMMYSDQIIEESDSRRYRPDKSNGRIVQNGSPTDMRKWFHFCNYLYIRCWQCVLYMLLFLFKNPTDFFLFSSENTMFTKAFVFSWRLQRLRVVGHSGWKIIKLRLRTHVKNVGTGTRMITLPGSSFGILRALAPGSRDSLILVLCLEVPYTSLDSMNLMFQVGACTSNVCGISTFD